MLIISIKSIIWIILIFSFNRLTCSRQFQDPVWIGSQEARLVCVTHREHPGKASGRPKGWHLDWSSATSARQVECIRKGAYTDSSPGAGDGCPAGASCGDGALPARQLCMPAVKLEIETRDLKRNYHATEVTGLHDYVGNGPVGRHGPVLWSNIPGQRRIPFQSVHYYLFLHHFTFIITPFNLILVYYYVIIRSLLHLYYYYFTAVFTYYYLCYHMIITYYYCFIITYCYSNNGFTITYYC